MKSNIIILLLFIFFYQDLSSQEYDKNYFRAPVNIPIRLAGNFGEIRPNHFHSGIDIKVPYSGIKLYAAADGYISRIRKSKGGYGNVLYITHPNGLMTVYAHMQKFNDTFEAYSEKIQYELNSFEYTHYPDSTELKVNKGDLIGYAGNTGRSYGPHLHFEIREAEKDVPVNPLYFNFDIKDIIQPKIFELIAYPVGEGSTVNGSRKKQIFKAYKGKYGYYIKNTVEYSGKIGFSVRTCDYMNYVKNTQGLYSIKTEYDTSLIYHHKLDRISFYDTRYINSFIDYEERQKYNKKFQKCFIEPGNNLDIYDRSLGDGIISSDDKVLHTVKITVSDIDQNSTFLKFKIIGTPVKEINQVKKEKFKYNEDNYFVKENFRAYIKKGSLYNDIDIYYKEIKRTEGLYSDIYEFNSYLIPIHDKIHVAVRSSEIPKNLLSKALIVYIDKNGKQKPLGGHYLNDFIAAQAREFGKYALTIDTVPPSVNDENPDITDYTDKKAISFLIDDNLSGIDKYFAEVDGKKIIFEYDEKNDRIKYTFDKHINLNQSHILRITVFDKKNNKTLFEKEFFK